MAWDLDDPASYVFYGLAVVVGLSVFYVVDRFEGWTCNDQPDKAYMEPEIGPSEFRLGRQARPPLKRESVLYRIAGGPERSARVVAMAGDYVELDAKDGLRVNGDKQPEEAVLRNRYTELDVPKVLVPRNCVFVLVDRRIKAGSALSDSRALGPIDLDGVISVFTAKPANKDSRR
jgi:hypothetical protein